MAEKWDEASVLSDLRLEVHPGEDLVARFAGVVLLMRAPLPRERSLAAQLIELCSEAPHRGQDGRTLLRRVAGVLAAAEHVDVPAFALVAPTQQRIAALLHGDVQVVVHGRREQRLSSTEAATWVDRVVDADFDRMTARFSDRAVPSTWPALDLRAGVVPGAGWTLARRASQQGAPPGAGVPHEGRLDRTAAVVADDRRSGAPLSDAAALPDAPGTEKEAAAAPPPRGPRPLPQLPGLGNRHAEPEPQPVPAASRPVFDSVLLLDETSAEPDRAALPVFPEAGAGEVSDADASEIEGILCANGHFNDPAALYCRIDGVSLAQRTHSFVKRARPPLGVLVFDDGSSYSVDGNYVLGREPERDENVQQGRARPLVVKDDEEAVSRVHAEIQLEGWNLIILDRGSVNGTYLAPPGTTVWTPLSPGRPMALAPGTRVQIGGRVFVYDSHLKV